MFEKEAEEYSESTKTEKEIEVLNTVHDWGSESLSPEERHLFEGIQDRKQARKQGFKDGAKFGYNKANEWHYMKDGDLPKDDKQYLVLFFYNYKGKKEMSFGVRDNLHSDFEIHRCYTEQIAAWKEIVLPELKESK